MVIEGVDIGKKKKMMNLKDIAPFWLISIALHTFLILIDYWDANGLDKSIEKDCYCENSEK